MANNDTILATIGGMAYRYQYFNKTKKFEQANAIHEALEKFINTTAPSGSGFDSGTQLMTVTPSRLVLRTSFHHLNDGGYYDGWTHHKIIIVAQFDTYDMRITGKDRNSIKDYIGDMFTQWLDTKMSEVMDSQYQNCYFNYNTCEWEKQGNNN